VLTADTTVTWSLSGGSNSDYRLTKAACWPLSLNRLELGAQVSNLETSRSKRDGSANSPTAHKGAPGRRRTGALTLTRRPLYLLSYRGEVRSAGLEPAENLALDQARLPELRHERMEPLDRLERSPPGYDAGTLPVELQRRGCPPWTRTTIAGSRVQRPTDWTNGHRVRKCATGDLNPDWTQVKSLSLYR
jgi:hypothetical protein